MDTQLDQKPRSAMAITGLVLGIIAIATSLLPFINNMSFIVALLGAVFSIVGVVGCVRGTRRGKGMAIAALVINILAFVLVLASQSAYSAAIDDALSGPDVASVSADASADDAGTVDDVSAGDDAAQQTDGLAVGSTVELENGLAVTVNSVQGGVQDYDGSELIAVNVTYVNNGEEGADYNTLDWKGEDAQGAQENTAFFIDATDPLESGSLAAGGTKSGTLYFKGGTTKVLYFSNMFNDAPSASWTIQ